MVKQSKNSVEAKKAKTNQIPFGIRKEFNYKLIFPIIIFSFALLLFARTVPFDLVNSDDDFMILENQEFNKDIGNIFASFDRTFFADDVYYRPMLNISFILDYQIAGLDVWMYRLTNVIYHAISSLLLFFFFVKLKFRYEYAFLFSLLFVAHPVVSPAVAWISGRNDSLLAIFILLSFITLIDYKESSQNTKWKYLILHLFVYTISLYTKETAALSPFLMAAYLLFFRNKEKFFSKENIYLAIGWVVIGTFWFFMRQGVVDRAIGTGELESPLAESLVTNLPSFIAYISKTFVPIRMSPLANYELFALIIGAVAVIGIAVYTFVNKKIDRKIILFGFLWYLFFIVPSMLARIKDFDFDYAEHRIYIPIIGILIIVIEILRSLRIDFTKVKEIAAFAIIFLLFSVATLAYQSKFDGPLRFWGHFIKTYPHTTRGFIGVGKHYFVKKEYDKVEKIMKKGISVKPNFKYWYTNLSTIYLSQQKFALAEENARKSIQYDKNDYQAHINLGYALGAQSRFKEAVPVLERALNLADKPDRILLKRLADAYFKAGYNDASIRAYNHYISVYPDDIAVYYELARVYSGSGMPEKSEEIFKKLESYNPNSIQLYINWGTFYAENKNTAKAEEIWLKALKIDPNNEQLLLNLIQLYSLIGKKDIALSFADRYEKQGRKLPPALRNMLNQ
jgi:tetratricopeptide (TPR) repeat protein